MAIFEVPDALMYGHQSCSVGPLFWFAMKEHINHFTPNALIYSLTKSGFSIVEVSRKKLPMKSGNFFSSLLIAARKLNGHSHNYQPLVHQNEHNRAITSIYFEQTSFYKNVIYQFNTFVRKYKQITFWGIGLEFFNLIAHTNDVFTSHQIRLLDSNQFKHGRKFNGISIISPNAATIEGCLICCSYLSRNEIVSTATDLRWPLESIFTL